MASRLNWLVVLILSFSVPVFAQPLASEIKFKTAQIKFGLKKIKVELAESPEQHERGLMYRTEMPDSEGMLFIFNEERPLSFWMKNTYIDLAIAYINHDKKIVDIQEMKATSQLLREDPPSYPSKSPALYALEMNKGWFKRNKIKVGDKFVFLQSKAK